METCTCKFSLSSRLRHSDLITALNFDRLSISELGITAGMLDLSPAYLVTLDVIYRSLGLLAVPWRIITPGTLKNCILGSLSNFIVSSKRGKRTCPRHEDAIQDPSDDGSSIWPSNSRRYDRIVAGPHKTGLFFTSASYTAQYMEPRKDHFGFQTTALSNRRRSVSKSVSKTDRARMLVVSVAITRPKCFAI